MTENMNDKQAMTALKQHGGNIVLAIVVALAAFFGWQYYQNNYAKIDTVAADLYTVINTQHEELALAAQNPDASVSQEVAKARAVLYKDVDALVAAHGETVYAWQSLMIKARHQADAGDVDGALASLEAASKVQIEDEGLIAISHLQLAQLLLDKGEVDKALTTANLDMPESFEPSRQEVLGDIYVAKKDAEAAKTAYNKAWELLAVRHENRALLNLKMQALGMTTETIEPKYQVVNNQTLSLADDGEVSVAHANSGDTTNDVSTDDVSADSLDVSSPEQSAQ